MRAVLELRDVNYRSNKVREAHRHETNYFRNHQRKMTRITCAKVG